MGYTFQGVDHGSTGYNGATGAKAAWNDDENMWIDDAGNRIRDDAITGTGGDAAVTGGPSSSPMTPWTAPVSPTSTAVTNSINTTLATPEGVNTNDPAYQQQLKAQGVTSTRNAERARASAAQRANANGTIGSGGFDTQVNNIERDRGESDQRFESQLMAGELQAQRTKIAQALQLGAGIMSQEQTLAMQDRLAQLDAAIRREGYGLQRDLGMADIGVRRDQLGVDTAFRGAELDQNALLALLRGT